MNRYARRFAFVLFLGLELLLLGLALIFIVPLRPALAGYALFIGALLTIIGGVGLLVWRTTP